MTRIHLSLQTTDLPGSIAFYTALFGDAPDKVRDDYARFQPPGAPIALSLMPGVPQPGPHHLGLKLGEVSQTRDAWSRLVDAGLAVRTEEEVTCCWAVQNKAWVLDPDGRAWEIYTVTDDAPATRDGTATACCA